MRDLLRRLWKPRAGPAAAAPAAGAQDVAAFRSAPRIYGPVDPDRLRRACPELTATIMASANAAVDHRFNLLGSGPYRPVDPDRGARGGYDPIDWALDPVCGARFPNQQPSAGCDIAAIRPPSSDIKRPWELARCYHWATLGQAWLLGGDARHARELFLQADDFMEANPVGRGIQWTCTMDVAIRAANWVIGLELVRDAPVDEASWVRALDAVIAHGRFIRTHLENHYEVTSNHFLSNIVGLQLAGLALRHWEEGRAWFEFASSALEAEMAVQVLPDGMDFESSVPYHRLVTELFFAGWRAALSGGRELSAAYADRLRQMHAFLAAVLRPDGLMPQVGDADDGRLHVFRGHDEQRPQDPRHLFGPAAAAFGERGWLSLAGPEGAWDAAWWGLTVEEAPPFAAPPVHAFFPEAGLLSYRDAAGTYLLVTNAKVGTKGFGNHKHNDLLSFEYHVNGRPLVVDPGSHVYTSDPDSRNLMRSVRSHSSVAPAGAEPNEFKPEWLFRMFERASPEHVEVATADRSARYTGRHRGFEPLGLAVSRTFALDPGVLRIVDSADTAPESPLPMEWRFQLDPRVHADETGGALRLTTETARVRLDWPRELAMSIEAAWYSPSYGVRVPSRQIVLRGSCARGASVRWTFVFTTEAPVRQERS
ncbi:MAG TPA: alginate lyase family protein [Vicinamibacterales bacterium]|nr:alginate lyase family protein [Vicinamibacterales bacterium]